MALLGRPRQVPVSVLTGFLGSGKTTVLNQVLRTRDLRNTAVIINEFGEVGVDHLLVEQVDEQMVTLSRGCVCCTIRGDLLATLRDLFRRRREREIPNFDRILVETTGLADPVPIVHALVESAWARAVVFLDTVAATVDAVNGPGTFVGQPEAVKQAAMADVLLLTKRDVADEAGLARTRERVRSLNPGAPIVEVEHGHVDPGLLFGRSAFDPSMRAPDVQAWLADEALREHRDHGHAAHSHGHRGGNVGHALGERDYDVNRHGDDIIAFAITRDAPLRLDVFRQFVRTIVTNRGEDLLRLKGILYTRETPNRPVVIHAVQHIMHRPRQLRRWPADTPRETRLVFITRDISRDDVEHMLTSFERSGGGDLYSFVGRQ